MNNDWYDELLNTVSWLLYGASYQGAKILRKDGFRGYYKYRIELCCNYLERCIADVRKNGV